MDLSNQKSSVTEVVIGELKTLKPKSQVFRKKVECSSVFFLTTSDIALEREILKLEKEKPSKTDTIQRGRLSDLANAKKN
ncbi:hypothetical protein DSO57_1005719 [Entomophthora muscae]|uniref:Uncharacterized protein n=1 Tax=Entomophthora muscae TaxID=34485 RepID=A0ACC2SKJ8_9FUNG|nr:hypothetical protein DSO57_1005719 [Entomophthora muscae]